VPAARGALDSICINKVATRPEGHHGAKKKEIAAMTRDRWVFE